MTCEFCGREHNGLYGSGRFCNASCARSYSSNINKEQKSRKTSNTLRTNFRLLYGKTKYEQEQEQKATHQQEIKACVDTLLADGFKYVVYSGKNFGCNYIVNTQGVIIATATLHKLKHTAYSDDKYKRVVLTDIYHHKHIVYVHKIVACTFIPNPNNYPLINHKDENPANNEVTNLEWCTYSYNNTYNNTHIKRGRKASETIKRKGGAWNKGKKMK